MFKRNKRENEMKKLYNVTVETNLIVWAEDDKKDVIDVTQQALRDHISNIDASEIYFNELTSLKQLPLPWDGNCLPYISYKNTDERTIAEILENKNV